MKYYPHHIGDFDRATRHLSRIERSIYRDLLDVYYDTEQMLTLDQPALCRKIIARQSEEAEAVSMILAEFFVQTPTGWYHDRCEEELEAYRKNNTQKSAAGKASAAARAEKRQQALNGKPTPVERPLNGCTTAQQQTSNHEPVTNNQKPVTKEKTPPVGDDELFPNVDPQVIADFKSLRKQKRSTITRTAMDKIAAEAVKAGLSLEAALRVCCSRGWAGFEAEWVAAKIQSSAGPPQYQTANEKAKAFSDRLTGRDRNEQHSNHEFIDLNERPS